MRNIPQVSTEGQADVKEGSLKSQMSRLKSLIKSKNNMREKWKLVKVYVEKGCSGKDLNRPQIQLLLADILKQKINVVLCTRVDRITRSLIDFYYLFRIFEKHDTAFICFDDNFDTSTPMGRMSLKMILVFAELEREQAADRTKKCLHSRGLAGLWNGGQVLGYDINRNNPGYLKINQDEKKLVKTIFKTYLRTNSLKKTCNYLNSRNFKTKTYISRRGNKHCGTIFRLQSIRNILNNKIYTGKIEINKKNKYKNQSSLPPEARYQVVPGQHKAIIDATTFAAVQKK
ncbi:MAG: recombinase family protein [Elusimicrobiota bacterium]